MSRQQKSYLIIFAFAIIKFLVPFLFIHPAFELHRDEYLYLADADHLAWGYIEMPPMLAVMGAISKLGGTSFYTIYFWDALFGSATLVLVGKIVLQLKGNSYAVFIACLSFLTAGFLRIHILFQPNILDIFFWTLSSYLLIYWINTDDKKYLYYLGVCFGLGMLAKYTIVFFIVSFLISLVIPSKSKWLLNKHLYCSLFLGLLIASPNLIWQVTHHFPVLHHMQLLQEQQLQHISRIQFLIDQVLLTLPCFYIWMMGLWFVFAKKEGRKYISIGIIYLSTIGLFLLLQGKSYYAAGIYPVLFSIGGTYLGQIIESYSRNFIRWSVAIGIPVIMLFLCFSGFPVLLPYQSPQTLEKTYIKMNVAKMGLLNWEDGKAHALPQDFADMLGWKEMALKVASAYNTLDSADKKHTIIFCDNYGQAGAVNYYQKAFHIPKPYSLNASFIYWIPDSLSVNNIVLLTEDKKELEHSFIKDFQSAVVTDSVTNHYAKEQGDLIIILKGANQHFNRWFKEKIEREKALLQ